MAQVVRVTTTAFHEKVTHQNVLHFNDTSATYNPTAIANEIRDNWIPKIRVICASTVRWNLVQVRNLSVSLGATSNIPIDIAGSGGTVTEWWDVACVVFTIHTATGGRAGRGRFYISGFFSGNITQGQFNSAAQAQNATVAANLMTRFVGPAATSFLRLGVAPRTGTPTLKDATEVVPRLIPGSQRRRNVGVGI